MAERPCGFCQNQLSRTASSERPRMAAAIPQFGPEAPGATYALRSGGYAVISVAEPRLGLRLPAVLSEYYLLAASFDRFNGIRLGCRLLAQ
jgi:hypothetical protein